MDNDVLDRIKSLRRAKKLSQSDFAELAGIPDRTYSDYERGVTPIPTDRLISIAKALGCSPAELYGEGPPQPTTKEFITMKDLAKMEESLVERLSKTSVIASPWAEYGAVKLDKEELRVLRAFRGLSQKGKDIITSQLDVALKKHPLVIKDAK